MSMTCVPRNRCPTTCFKINLYDLLACNGQVCEYVQRSGKTDVWCTSQKVNKQIQQFIDRMYPWLFLVVQKEHLSGYLISVDSGLPTIRESSRENIHDKT